jgi:hypothetical protein
MNMYKALIAGAVVIGAVVLAKRHAPSRDGLDFEKLIERMPDNAPPKWAFKHQRDSREPDLGNPRQRAQGRHG